MAKSGFQRGFGSGIAHSFFEYTELGFCFRDVVSEGQYAVLHYKICEMAQ